MEEPLWIDRIIADAIHHDQLSQHGGRRGLTDENALESALARPRNKWAYAPESDIAALAAAYGYGFARNHAYSDGNKRVAFMVMYTFLRLNGYDVRATEPEVVQVMVAVADGGCDEQRLAEWVRERLAPAAD